MWNQIAFGGFLVVVAGGLYWQHLRAEASWADELANWPEAAHPDQARQTCVRHRRRVLACGLIGLVGVALMAGAFLEATLHVALFWAAILILVSSIVWLGMADLWSTRRHMRALSQQQREATVRLRAELEAEITRLRAASEPKPPPLDSA